MTISSHNYLAKLDLLNYSSSTKGLLGPQQMPTQRGLQRFTSLIHIKHA